MAGIDTHTLLLLHGTSDFSDASLKNVQITNSGVSFGGGGHFGGKAMFFNGGATTRLEFPQANFVIGNSDFTIDWWEYPASNNTSGGSRFSSSWTNWGGLLVGYLGTKVYGGTAANKWDVVGGTVMFSVTPKVWTHWALVRRGSKLTTYRNGVKFAEVTVSKPFWNGATNVIGNYSNQDRRPFYGYLSEFRISNVARWTSNFTPPTEPYSYEPPPEQFVDEHTKLLIHGDKIEDASPYKVSLTNFGVIANLPQINFGKGSFYFNGNSRIEFPSATIVYGLSDFTIDWWENCDPMTVNQGVRYYSRRSPDMEFGGLLIGFRNNNVYASTAPYPSKTWDLINGALMINIIPGQWVHWAFVRHNGILTSYRNGAVYAVANCNGTIVGDEKPHSIGEYTYPNNRWNFKGYMQEFRISDIARWTSYFDPPTAPYKDPKPPLPVFEDAALNYRGLEHFYLGMKPKVLQKGEASSVLAELKRYTDSQIK